MATTPALDLAKTLADADKEAADSAERTTHFAEAVVWANIQLPDIWADFKLQLSDTASQAIKFHATAGQNARRRAQTARALKYAGR